VCTFLCTSWSSGHAFRTSRSWVPLITTANSVTVIGLVIGVMLWIFWFAFGFAL
jgi:hypothetical protein